MAAGTYLHKGRWCSRHCEGEGAARKNSEAHAGDGAVQGRGGAGEGGRWGGQWRALVGREPLGDQMHVLGEAPAVNKLTSPGYYANRDLDVRK